MSPKARTYISVICRVSRPTAESHDWLQMSFSIHRRFLCLSFLGFGSQIPARQLLCDLPSYALCSEVNSFGVAGGPTRRVKIQTCLAAMDPGRTAL